MKVEFLNQGGSVTYRLARILAIISLAIGGPYMALATAKSPSNSNASLIDMGTYHLVAEDTIDRGLESSARVTVSAPNGTLPELTPGVWKEITPPAAGFAETYGTTNMEVSPVDPNVIYVSIDQLGMWKSTDRGSNWRRLGVQAPYKSDLKTTYLDSPLRVEVDPSDANHVVAIQGVRGNTMGFWESRDAGETWTMPRGFFDASRSATVDITSMAIDPTNFKHILLGSHSPWGMNTNNQRVAGILETVDGGRTWILHEGMPSWPTGSLGINFLYDPSTGQGDPSTWLVATDGDGIWRTTNAGESWARVSTINVGHGGAQIYYAKDGTLYSGAKPFPVRSRDNGLTWEHVQNGLTNFVYFSIYGDGSTLYTQLSSGFGGHDPQPYMTTSEITGGPWMPYQGGAQKFSDGPFFMTYDAVNGIMYSANWRSGVWALKVIKP